nr:Cln5-like protein [Ipomoea batatas]
MILGGSSLHLNLSLLRLLHLIFTLAILDGLGISSVSASCDYSFGQNNKLYTYNLTSPISNFPHGVLSEDGFYRVAANGTVIWFQLCETMLFNHDPPMCVDCVDCGGGSRCGMGCSALASSIIGGYPVCSTLGRPSTTSISLIDNNSPLRGIVVKMYHSALKNCSLAVSVVCDETATGPQTLEKVGTCDFVKLVSIHITEVERTFSASPEHVFSCGILNIDIFLVRNHSLYSSLSLPHLLPTSAFHSSTRFTLEGNVYFFHTDRHFYIDNHRCRTRVLEKTEAFVCNSVLVE